MRQVSHPPTCLRKTRTIFLSGKQFDVAAAVLNALKNLKVTLDIDCLVKIDDCKPFPLEADARRNPAQIPLRWLSIRPT
jgi:hypothetical protein